MELLLYVFVVGLGASGVSGYATGAPKEACVSMTPGHGTEQTIVTDFSMNITSGLTNGKYTPGQSVQVEVDGLGAPYKGILLQARKAGATFPYGKWTSPPTNTKVVECSNPDDAVTHSSDADKPLTTYTWVPPTDCDAGTIEFVATIAMQKDMWWKNIKTTGVMGTYPTGTAACSTQPANDNATTRVSYAVSTITLTVVMALISLIDNWSK